MKLHTFVAALAAVALCATPASAQSSSRSASCDDRPVAAKQLFGQTVTNFTALKGRDTALILGAGAAAAFATHPADASVSRSASTSPNGGWFRAGATIGSTPVQVGASMAAYSLGRALGKPCVASVGAHLFQAQIMAQALTIGLKAVAHRDRPSGSGWSFPSGHTAVSFATATVLQQHYGWKVGIPAYGVAAYVAASRIETRKHYLSDVAFGAALGILAGHTVTLGHRREWSLGPMVTEKGGGVGFTWQPRP